MDESHIDHERRFITMSEIMTPDRANFHGNVHGGYLLSLLDRVAYACGARYAASKNIVTFSVDQVFFRQPIFVGELVTFYAGVNFVGTTSMEVGIRVVAENLQTRVVRHTNTCFFTMVALDEKGKPTSVPPLILHTEIDRERYNAAKLRREMRMKLWNDSRK